MDIKEGSFISGTERKPEADLCKISQYPEKESALPGKQLYK